MPLPRPTTCIVAIASALTAACAAGTPRTLPSRSFDLVNASFDSVTRLEVAPAGSGDFQPIALGRALQGGLDTATVRMPAGDCLRDLRITFPGDHEVTLHRIDVCRVHGLRFDAR